MASKSRLHHWYKILTNALSGCFSLRSNHHSRQRLAKNIQTE